MVELQLTKVTKVVKALIPEATPEQVTAWIDLSQGKVGGRFWTLDLIDGTKGFLRGDQYAIAIALIESGEVKLGAIVVEEAGGRVSDMYGKPLNFSADIQLIENRGIVASQGEIHDAVLAAIAANTTADGLI